MNKIKSVPNQRIIKIPNRITSNNLLKMNKTIFEKALLDLSGNEFKIWCYLYNHEENSEFALSSAHLAKVLGISKQTYHRVFSTLVEKKYLIQTSRENYYIFADTPGIIPTPSPEETKEEIKISLGEKMIKSILLENNIDFCREASFGTCLFSDTNYPAKFDFYINGEYLVEFDGEQHFQASGKFWNTSEQLQKTQEHDEYKNQWCKDNNIPLIRIPYTKLNTLCIEDLLLETTQFRVV